MVHLLHMIFMYIYSCIIHTCTCMYTIKFEDGTSNCIYNNYFSLNLACEHVSASRCPSCNSAVDVLVDAFTTSVQVFLGGEGNEPLLPPPHRRFHGHSNLLKGFSKVSNV